MTRSVELGKTRALCRHDFLKAISFHQQLLVTLLTSGIILVLDINDGPMNGRNTLMNVKSKDVRKRRCMNLYDNIGQKSLQLPQTIILVRPIYVYP